MDEEIPRQIGKRYEIESCVENTRPRLGKKQRERAILGLEAINLALDELSYDGETLPLAVFADDLKVNGTPRVGGFAPDWEGNGDQPSFFMDTGDHPAEKAFGDELIEHFRQTGWSEDSLNKLALVDTFFEETYHYVDFTKGSLPKGMGGQGRFQGYENYYDQPHERAARDFAERMTATHFNSLVYGKPELY